MKISILSTKNLVRAFAMIALMMICLAPLFAVAASDFEATCFVGVSDARDKETKEIYELKVFNKELADEYLDTDENTPTELFGEGAEVGAKMAIKVDLILGVDDAREFKRGNVTIMYLIWGWTTDVKDLEDDDDATMSSEMLHEADELGEDLNVDNVSDIFDKDVYFVPKVNSELTPTSYNAANFLASLKLDEDDVEDKKIIILYSSITVKYAKDVVQKIEFYNALGLRKSFKLVTADGETIVEISSIAPAAPPLDWTIMLGLWVGIGTVVASGLWTLWRIKRRGA